MDSEKTLFVRRLHPEAKLPAYAMAGDSGLDLYAVETKEIPTHQWETIRTGIAIQLPAGTEGQIRPRSGLAQQSGITILNSPCTIDNGYRGELKIVLINHGPTSFIVRTGMRIAQLVVKPVLHVDPQWSAELSPSSRGTSGFGSTGR
jgi:dUTP pyrophosphatase